MHPIYYECKRRFGVSWDGGVCCVYGDTAYCKYDLRPDVIAHESVHVRQQSEMGPMEWWKRYFADKKFRLEQEIEAYKEQMKFVRENCSRDFKRDILRKCAHDLAGPMYGNMITLSEAFSILE
ncbi:MAG: hypothetical protein V4478_03280 [Patescibacteria group bacterium]